MTADSKVGRVQFGDFERVVPISRDCSADRGTPVDRYYVDHFLASHQSDIRGRVLEIGGDTYTKRLGGDRVTHAQALNIERGTSAIVEALMQLLVDDSCRFDCVLLPQTLHFIYNISAAIRSTHTVLAPGGVVLATFPGISQLSPNRDADSQCWGFTSRSARLKFEETFSPDSVSVVVRGNVLASIAVMQGLAVGELTANELDHVDPAYEVIVGVRASRTTHPA